MIDWTNVLFNGVWLTGAALLLALVGFYDYSRVVERRTLRSLWQNPTARRWLHVGGCLFCSGMALTGSSVLEQSLWALLGLYLLVDLTFLVWSAPRREAMAASLASAVAVAAHPQLTARRTFSLAQVAEWLMRRELLWLALLSPFYLFPSALFAPALLGVPLLWLARRIARGRFLPPTPLDWPLALLSLMSLVSLYATFDIGFSLPKVAGLLFGVGIYYAVVEWGASRDRIGWALSGYALLGGALSVVGLLGAGWVNKIPILKELGAAFPRLVQGVPGAENGINPNEVAGALLWVAPLHIALFAWSCRGGLRVRSSVWAQRVALLLLVTLSSGTLLLTQSRSALLGFGVAMLLLLFLVLRRAGILLLLLLASAALTTAVIGPQKIVDKLVQSYGTGLSPAAGISSAVDRVEIWSRAIYGIEDFSFTGMGMGTFRRVMPILYPTFSFDSSPGGVDIGHAHNHLLQAALDLGLPGLIGYLAIWMLSGTLVVSVWRRSRERLLRAVVAGTGAGLLAYFIYGMTDTVALGAKPGVFYWALLGILVALWRAVPAPSPPVAVPERPRDARTEVERDTGPQETEEAEEAGVSDGAAQPVLSGTSAYIAFPGSAQ